MVEHSYFVENFHVNNLSVMLEIFHAFNFCETRVPTKINIFRFTVSLTIKYTAIIALT